MHELSIALSIVEIAEAELARHGGRRVRAVHLNVAPGIVAKEALLFSFGLVAEGTAAEGSSLVFCDSPTHELEIVGLEIE
jgi:hydrogenase nickel incorporation protein HypA/HybF